MPNVRLFVFLRVCAVFKEKIHPQTSPSIFSAVFWPPSQVFTRDSSITQGPGCGVGRDRGNWVEVRHQGQDCHMKPYADKLFVALYFSVRSTRSSAHGRHFANIPWGRELGFHSARWMRKARKMETCRGHSALTDWAGKPIGSWESFWSSLLHDGRWNMTMK